MWVYISMPCKTPTRGTVTSCDDDEDDDGDDDDGDDGAMVMVMVVMMIVMMMVWLLATRDRPSAFPFLPRLHHLTVRL